MRRRAIRRCRRTRLPSGAIDLKLPVEQMAGKLLEYARGLGRLDPDGRGRADRTRLADGRRAICEILHERTGHDFSGYKERTFLRRIERRMQVLDLRRSRRLCRAAASGPAGGDQPVSRPADRGHRVLPRSRGVRRAGHAGHSDSCSRARVRGTRYGSGCRAVRPARRRIRSRSCCSNTWRQLTVRPKTVVFATDIDDPAIAVARHAHYPAAMLQDVGPERLDRYFAGDGISYTLAKEVRDLCIFSSHSVIRDPPFSRIDLISCRNLLIYLDRELQNQLLPVFHYALRPGGFLFLGSSEALTTQAELFDPVDKKYRIFRRRDHVGVHPDPAAGAAQRAAAGRRSQAHRQEPYRPAAAAYRREPGSRTVRAGACRRDARRRRRAFFDADRQISRKRARRPDTQHRRDGAARIAARPADRADRGGRDRVAGSCARDCTPRSTTGCSSSI